ncbi:transporter [Noviherbaspirillum sp. 17J57-3]|uniref:Transporter n=1 Tax=Noviherbaspirillum galbum TaxID=2709383 RepID=A0A6B3ST96_9BURK|nr:transporter [Noviherbaspirillum galbum]
MTVNPYRPSVSNPAEPPPPGQLELEFGALHGRSGDARTTTLPYLFKLGLADNWGFLLGGDAYIWSRDDQGQRERGVGDTSLTLKRAYPVNESTSLGWEATATVPTAKESLGAGKADYTLNGIYSRDMGELHLDVNLNATRVGNPEPGTARMAQGLSVALSANFAHDWSGTAELSGTHRTGVAADAQLLAAIAYSPGKRYAVDVGIARGLTRGAQDWAVFSGFVIPLGKFW